MFVKNIMIPKLNCFTVTRETQVGEALKIMNDHNLDALPVLDGDQYIGTMTRYRIYERFFNSQVEKSEFLSNMKVGEISTLTKKVIKENDLFEKSIFEFKDFPQIAVVNDQNAFQGIITRHDVLEQFESAFGMKVPGVRITLTSVETKGRLAKLAEVSKSFNEQIISVVTFDETDKLVRRIVLKVAKNDNLMKFLEKVESVGFRVLHVSED